MASSPTVRVSRRIQEKIQRQLDAEMPARARAADGVLNRRGRPKKDPGQPTKSTSDDEIDKTAGDDMSSSAGDGMVKKAITTEGHTEVMAFGGAAGGAFLTLFLPVTVYIIVLACDKSNGCTVSKLPSYPRNWQSFIDFEVFGVVLVWYTFQAVLAVLPVGPLSKGQPLRNGHQLEYRCNGFLALLITTVLFSVGLQADLPVDYISKHWLQFVTASIFYSTLLSIAIYIKALYADRSELAPESTGSLFNDFFMGRELNPRIGSLDLKFFFELRPGLIGWVVIDWCLCASQYKVDGSVAPALALVTLFQTVYVFDALRNEAAILTTMDITTEGFGFMLAFGDLVWVPCLYSLQAHFLFTYPQNAVSNPYALFVICAVEVVGLIIFRGANSQKDTFRTNPTSQSVARLATIPTSTGKKLLCGGFWGMCRRPNYLGDLLMATAWSLTCGTSHLLPYFYPLYFFVLLVHRQMRDEVYCKQRYGPAWDRYCAVVPYRIIPYIF